MNWLCALIVVFACIICACMLLFYFCPYAHLVGSRNKQTSIPKTSRHRSSRSTSFSRRTCPFKVLSNGYPNYFHHYLVAGEEPIHHSDTLYSGTCACDAPFPLFLKPCICRSLRLCGTLTIQSCSSTSSWAPRRWEEYSSKYSQVQITLNLAAYAEGRALCNNME